MAYEKATASACFALGATVAAVLSRWSTVGAWPVVFGAWAGALVSAVMEWRAEKRESERVFQAIMARVRSEEEIRKRRAQARDRSAN